MPLNERHFLFNVFITYLSAFCCLLNFDNRTPIKIKAPIINADDTEAMTTRQV